MKSNISKAKNNLSYYKRLIESGKTLTNKQQTRYEELMNIVKDYYQKPVLTEEEKQKMRLNYIQNNRENAKRRYHEKVKTNPKLYQRCREYAKNYYQTHKEEERARSRKKYQEHKEEMKARVRSYYHEHKEEAKSYYQEHKEEAKKRYQEKIKTNPELYQRCREYAKNYYQEHKEELKAKRELKKNEVLSDAKQEIKE